MGKLTHKTILHVDMDAFFASIEQRDRPELQDRPVIVGGSPERRGVVSTCSYEARKFGIHSAMPTRTALRLCPQAVLIRPNHRKYSAVSRKIREIVHEVTDLVEPVSIDEAYLDITPGAVSVMGLMNDTENHVRLLIDADLLEMEDIGCHPCVNTASIRLSMKDLADEVVFAFKETVGTGMRSVKATHFQCFSGTLENTFFAVFITEVAQHQRHIVKVDLRHIDQRCSLNKTISGRTVDGKRTLSAVAEEDFIL